MSLVLIGPASAGKSTLAKILAERLGKLNVSLDDLRWNYYREIGFDPDRANEIRQKGGFLSAVFYWKQFDTFAVKRILTDYPDAIIDFGAGHSVYENRLDLEHVEKLLVPHNVVLILPSPDPEESIRVLHERTSHLVGTFAQNFDWHDYFVHHPSNYRLAKLTIYTQGKTPDETVDEILRRVNEE